MQLANRLRYLFRNTKFPTYCWKDALPAIHVIQHVLRRSPPLQLLVELSSQRSVFSTSSFRICIQAMVEEVVYRDPFVFQCGLCSSYYCNLKDGLMMILILTLFVLHFSAPILSTFPHHLMPISQYYTYYDDLFHLFLAIAIQYM